MASRLTGAFQQPGSPRHQLLQTAGGFAFRPLQRSEGLEIGGGQRLPLALQNLKQRLFGIDQFLGELFQFDRQRVEHPASPLQRQG